MLKKILPTLLLIMLLCNSCAPKVLSKWPLGTEKLTRGMYGQSVLELHQALIRHGDETLHKLSNPKQALYGPYTKNAIKNFQKRMQLPITGDADLVTIAYLKGPKK